MEKMKKKIFFSLYIVFSSVFFFYVIHHFNVIVKIYAILFCRVRSLIMTYFALSIKDALPLTKFSSRAPNNWEWLRCRSPRSVFTNHSQEHSVSWFVWALLRRECCSQKQLEEKANRTNFRNYNHSKWRQRN